MRLFGGLIASAVETSVSATRLAVLRKSFAKVFASAMQPYGQIVPCNAKRRGDFIGLLAFEIDLLEEIAVLLGDQRHEAFEALAENALILKVRRFRQFLLEAFEGASPRILASINVNNGPAKNAVEPCCGGLIAFRLAVCPERLHEAVLHNVLGEVWVVETAASEGCKNLKVFQQRIFKTSHAQIIAG